MNLEMGSMIKGKDLANRILYEKADGLSLLVFDKLFRELRRTKIRVSEKILRDSDLKTERI